MTYRIPSRSNYRGESTWHMGCLLTTLACTLAGALIGWGIWAYSFGSEHTVRITVLEKDDQSNSNGHTYLIHARLASGKTEVFKVADAYLHGKTRASDTYFGLVRGQTYLCDENGFRSGLRSSYKNLLSCTKVPSK